MLPAPRVPDGLTITLFFEKAQPDEKGATDYIPNNGIVKRTQRSDLEEFWATVDPKATDIEGRLAECSISRIGTGLIWRWAGTRQSTTFAIV